MGHSVPLLVKFKMALATILDLVFAHISMTHEDICVTFGTSIDIGWVYEGH